MGFLRGWLMGPCLRRDDGRGDLLRLGFLRGRLMGPCLRRYDGGGGWVRG